MIYRLLFDLDNTLYPENSKICADITARMISFVNDWLKLPSEQSAKMRQDGIVRYGTTLRWLEQEHGMHDIDGFFAYVHPPCEIDGLSFDPQLRSCLQSLAMPMAILTNAPMEHALRVLDFYNVTDIFCGRIYDIKFNNFVGKPYPQAFLKSLSTAGFPLEETLFLDDMPRYVDGFVALGGQALLVDQFDKHTDKTYNRIHSIHDLPHYLAVMNTTNADF